MKHPTLLVTLLFVAAVAVPNAIAQSPCNDPPPTGFVLQGSACASSTPFGTTVPTPFVDAGATYVYGTTGEIEALYGTYGNNEQTPGPAQQHYNVGTGLASQIVPLCSDGTTGGANGCSDQGPKRIVFLVIGFSNCDVEICGGHVDAWDASRANRGPGQAPLPQLAGQACATRCPNLQNPDMGPAYNEASRFNISDGYDQMSLLRQVYPTPDPATWLVGPSVVIFDGALGGQTLEKWDPTSIGYYATNNCDYNRTTSTDPECNYYRVADDLRTNKLTEAQVQAVFIKSGDSFPTCDLQHTSAR